jgi:parallel beta-helix repeat protein
MPPKRHMHRRCTLRVLLLCVALSVCGPGAVPGVAAHPASLTFGLVSRGVAASPANYVLVSTTTDTLDDADTTSFANLNLNPGSDGRISLREAMLAANNTIFTGTLTISFSIPVTDIGHQAGAWTIQLTQPLPKMERGDVSIDASTQLSGAQHPAIVLDGAQSSGDYGITIVSSGNLVRGFTFMNFYDAGLIISGLAASDNRVAGSYFGTDPTGTAARPNGTNIRIVNGAHHNLIGGSEPAARNLISGSDYNSGVVISGPTTHHNTIAGNWIGVDSSGDVALSNTFAGVLLDNETYENLIGGAGQGNVIADLGQAICIDNNSYSNTIAGNIIGLAAGGKKRLLASNGYPFTSRSGIVVTRGAHHNLIGLASQGNVISGNDTGISLLGGIGNTIAANIIGLDADGLEPLGNNEGLSVRASARDNLLGGSSPASRNIISGNTSHGVLITDQGTTNNRLQGNYIGTDKSGLLGRSNGQYGVLIRHGAEGNLIGGTTPGEGNVIVYNALGGVRIDSPANQMAGNYIGVGADGTTAIGNGNNGVRIVGNQNVIGPQNLIAHSFYSGIILNGTGNIVISNTLKFNGSSGICVAGPSTEIRGNQITENGGASHDWLECNIRSGIVITGTDHTVVRDNDILDNTNFGIVVHNGHSNSILSNSISGNLAGGIRLEQGSNGGIKPPVIESVTVLSISGSSCPACQVEIFADSGKEGKYRVGNTTADTTGEFSLPITPGSITEPFITATNTDSSGNTSPFAEAVDAPPPLLHRYLPLVIY